MIEIVDPSRIDWIDPVLGLPGYGGQDLSDLGTEAKGEHQRRQHQPEGRPQADKLEVNGDWGSFGDVV
jgi:hypothetical protein